VPPPEPVLDTVSAPIRDSPRLQDFAAMACLSQFSALPQQVSYILCCFQRAL
jgi:hypothetical protein